MNTAAIVLIAGFLSWWVASRQSLAAAFLQVYLPAILLLPDYYTLSIGTLIPKMSFGQAAILPIGFGLCWKLVVNGEWRHWSLSTVDAAVAAFLGWQVVSTLYNVGTPDRRLVFDLLTVAFFPYLAAKTLIEQPGMRAQVARRFVWLMFLVILISVYEFRMGVSLFRPAIGVFFPDQPAAWFTQIRWGFGRIAGPYGHAIHMGVFIGVAYILHRWLRRADLWEPRFTWASDLALPKAHVLTFALLAGLFMTLSRGPWLGAFAGVVLAWVGAQQNYRRAFTRAMAALAISGALVYGTVKTYVAGASTYEGLEEQASAAYRAVLIAQYEAIIMQRPLMGWGHANWPQVAGMSSIDNNYLYVALECGLIGATLLVVLLIVAMWRVFASAYFREGMSARERMFRFSLVGGLLVIALATTTTYIGAGLYALTFVLLGWSEAAVTANEAPAAERIRALPPDEAYRLMRVVA